MALVTPNPYDQLWRWKIADWVTEASSSVAGTGFVKKAGDTMTGNLTLTSTDPAAGTGPTISLARNRAAPVAGELLGTMLFSGVDAALAATNYAQFYAIATSITDGAETGELRFNTMTAGAWGLTLRVGGPTSVLYAHFAPGANNTYDLGGSSLRWRTVYTGDLSLKNDVGDWLIVEGEHDLFITNNKTGKRYKFHLIPVDED